MKFYPFLYSNTGVSSGFNSQRDEILLAIAVTMIPIAEVSIPNGMKFYCSAIFACKISFSFQFPTG